MNNSLTWLATAFAGGLILGLIFFVGLWLTLRRSGTKGFAFIYVVSFLTRSAIILGGFYYLASGSWKNMLAGVAGFTVTRFVLQSWTS